MDIKKYEPVKITEEMLSEAKISLTDLIMEARKQALKEDIKANTVMISKRLAKVNRFIHIFGNGGYADFPPLICGLEAFVTDEMPEEFAFGLVEAPTTQREHYIEEGRRAGYKQGYDEGYEQGIKDLAEKLKNYYSNLRGTTYAVLTAYHIEQAKKELLKEEEANEN